MKRIYISMSLALFFFHLAYHELQAQIPQGFNYQSVVRDASGNVLSNANLGLRFTIHEGGATGNILYSETLTSATNTLGLFSHVIGSATPTQGSFSGINWKSGVKYLQVEIDVTGGNNYVSMGASKLESVPYALSAPDEQTLVWEGSTKTLSITGGNSVILPISGGSVGPTGPKGDTGVQGLQGAKGATGAAGVKGTTGVTGPTGADGAANAWGLTGNGGTNSTTNFLGTTDNHALVLKVNNIRSGYIGNGAIENVIIGYEAGNSIPNSNSRNVFIGGSVGRTNTGSLNTAVGNSALWSNTSGVSNIAVGASALFSNSTGNQNVVIGNSAASVFNGDNIVAIGYRAMLNANSSSYKSVAIGDSALYNNRAFGTVGVGSMALHKNTTGSYNTSVGYQTLLNNTIGNSNTAIGSNALYSNSTGVSNTAVGSYVLNGNTTGNNNTAVGSYALGGALVTGESNSAFGLNALLKNTSGNGNSAFGVSSQENNTWGTGNTSVGINSLYSNTIGQGNTAIGFDAGAGASGINFSNCTFLGASSTITASRVNITMIGHSVQNGQITANNQIALGNTSISSIRAQVSGITAYSDARYKTNVKEDVSGLDFITKLKPVTYNVKPSELHKIWGTPDSIIEKINHKETEQIRYTGLIAQDVEKAMRESGYNFTGIEIPSNSNETYTLRYTEFIMPMIKAIQEQQKQIDELKNLLNTNK